MKYEVQRFQNSTRWLLNGKFHREGGPAIVYDNGSKSWWKNDKLHRVDGPAFEESNGNHLYFIEGTQYSKTAFETQISKIATAA